MSKQHMSRIEALIKICGDVYYQQLITKSRINLTVITDFIKFNDQLGHREFERAAQRMFLDKKTKPKNWTAIEDVLVAVNNVAVGK